MRLHVAKSGSFGSGYSGAVTSCLPRGVLYHGESTVSIGQKKRAQSLSDLGSMFPYFAGSAGGAAPSAGAASGAGSAIGAAFSVAAGAASVAGAADSAGAGAASGAADSAGAGAASVAGAALSVGAGAASVAGAAAGASAAGSLEVCSSLLHAVSVIARMLANRIVLFIGVTPRLVWDECKSVNEFSPGVGWLTRCYLA